MDARTKQPEPAFELAPAISIDCWLRGADLNGRPSGYEPDELPDCSTPRNDHRRIVHNRQTDPRARKRRQSASALSAIESWSLCDSREANSFVRLCLQRDFRPLGPYVEGHVRRDAHMRHQEL